MTAWPPPLGCLERGEVDDDVHVDAGDAEQLGPLAGGHSIPVTAAEAVRELEDWHAGGEQLGARHLAPGDTVILTENDRMTAGLQCKSRSNGSQ